MISLPELQLVFDNLDEGIIFITRSRRVIANNAAACRLLGHQTALDKLCPGILQGADCAKHCDLNDQCTFITENRTDGINQDIVVRRPDGALIQLRMCAIALPDETHCAIVLRGTNW